MYCSAGHLSLNVSVFCSLLRMTINYANGKNPLDLNKLSPIGLLPGVSLA